MREILVKEQNLWLLEVLPVNIIKEPIPWLSAITRDLQDKVQYSIAIGNLAAQTQQPTKCICMNAGSVALNPANGGFFVFPISQYSPTGTDKALYYRPSTNEIFYST